MLDPRVESTPRPIVDMRVPGWMPYPPVARSLVRRSVGMWLGMRAAVAIAILMSQRPGDPPIDAVALLPPAVLAVVALTAVGVMADARRRHETLFHANLATSPWAAPRVCAAVAGACEVAAALVLAVAGG
jgi:hypothetical protein